MTALLNHRLEFRADNLTLKKGRCGVCLMSISYGALIPYKIIVDIK